MKITCLECEKEFVPSQMNTQIIGPDVQVVCPFCNYQFKGKMTSFVRGQVGGKAQSAQDAARMQRLAQYIELNSSEYYKKRGLRHGTKKVRNIST